MYHSNIPVVRRHWPSIFRTGFRVIQYRFHSRPFVRPVVGFAGLRPLPEQPSQAHQTAGNKYRRIQP